MLISCEVLNMCKQQKISYKDCPWHQVGEVIMPLKDGKQCSTFERAIIDAALECLDFDSATIAGVPISDIIMRVNADKLASTKMTRDNMAELRNLRTDAAKSQRARRLLDIDFASPSAVKNIQAAGFDGGRKIEPQSGIDTYGGLAIIVDDNPIAICKTQARRRLFIYTKNMKKLREALGVLNITSQDISTCLGVTRHVARVYMYYMVSHGLVDVVSDTPRIVRFRR